jgi:DNA-binding MarR family transcriptional regulator
MLMRMKCLPWTRGDSIETSTIVEAIVPDVASRETTQTTDSAHGVIEERATSEGLLLALLGQQAMRRLRAAHTEHKLSPRQFHVLGLLHDRGALTQRELGTLMDVDPSILVTLLNPLEADGYLSRERDADDRRRHVVTITRRGEQQLERAAQAQRDAEDELLAGLTKTQRAQLRRLLLILREQSTAAVETACTASETNTRS